MFDISETALCTLRASARSKQAVLRNLFLAPHEVVSEYAQKLRNTLRTLEAVSQLFFACSGYVILTFGTPYFAKMMQDLITKVLEY